MPPMFCSRSVVIQSFSAESLKLLRSDFGCTLPLVYLTTGKALAADGLKAVRQFADGIAPNKADVLARPELVDDAHALGLSVTVWTCRSEKNGRFPTVREKMQFVAASVACFRCRRFHRHGSSHQEQGPPQSCAHRMFPHC